MITDLWGQRISHQCFSCDWPSWTCNKFNESSSSPPLKTFSFCFSDHKFHMQAITGLEFLPIIGSPGKGKEALQAEPIVEPLRSLMTNQSYLLHPLFLIPTVHLLFMCPTTASNHTAWSGHSSVTIYNIWEEFPLLSQIPSVRILSRNHTAVLWGFYLLSDFLPQ